MFSIIKRALGALWSWITETKSGLLVASTVISGAWIAGLMYLITLGMPAWVVIVIWILIVLQIIQWMNAVAFVIAMA